MLAAQIKIMIYIADYLQYADQRHGSNTHEHTKAGREHVCDSLGGVGQEEGPVETEDNDPQQNRDNDFVDWLNGGHTSADGESSCQDGDTMAQNGPAAALQVV